MGRLSRQNRPIVHSGRRKGKPRRLPADLKDLLSEGRLDKLHGELGRGVALIQNGIDLDYLERGHDPGVSNELHDQVGLPVVQAAFYRGSHSRGHGGIHRVEVQTHMHEVGTGSDLVQRLFMIGCTPCRSMSDMVWTCTPVSFSRFFSPASRLRIPTSATLAASTLGVGPPTLVSSGAPNPSRAARG